MKKCLLPCIFLFVVSKIDAQFGLTVATTLNSSPDWQVVVENYVTHRHMDFLRNGTAVSIDYILPGSNDKWRFQPTIHGMRATAFYYPHYFEAYSVGFQYNVGYSPMEIGTKKDPIKLFFTLSPGLGMVGMRYEEPVIEGSQFEGDYIYHTDRQIAFHIGASVLAEFELSQMLTISPHAGIHFYPNIDWTDFTYTLTDGDMNGTFDRTNWRQLFFALRFGLNLKKKQL